MREMKKILIWLIRGYQKIPGNFHGLCRHIPTCSNYAIEAITEYGSIKGSFLALKRILRCNPFGTSGYDPVPERKKKMKKFLLLMVLFGALLSTGCFKRDDLEDVTIYTTVYPVSYITERLYGEHSTIYSIYPTGVNPMDYKLTDKQIKDYSKGRMFIFNGLSSEKDYVEKLFHHNRKLKIIDTTSSMEKTYEEEELWLDPSNFLMLAGNIKNGFNEYISNHYLKNEIEENYQTLKVEISALDAEISTMYENSSKKTIVVANDVFKFLEKYGFTVYSLEENENLTEKTLADVKSMIQSGQIKYIFAKEQEENSKTVEALVKEGNVEVLRFHMLSNITEDEKNNGEDYISIMNKNLELLKQELYD